MNSRDRWSRIYKIIKKVTKRHDAVIHAYCRMDEDPFYFLLDLFFQRGREKPRTDETDKQGDHNSGKGNIITV